MDFGAVGPVEGRVVFVVRAEARSFRCLPSRRCRRMVENGRFVVAGAVLLFGGVAGGVVGGLVGGGGEVFGPLRGSVCELAVQRGRLDVEFLAAGQVRVGVVDPLLRLSGVGAEAVL